MHTPHTAAILIYDLQQLPMLEAMLPVSADTAVLSLDAELDMLLVQKGIEYLSARDYRSHNNETFLMAERIAERIERGEWDWFSYKGIKFSQVFFSTLQSYFTEALYWIDLLANFLSVYPDIKKLVVLPPAQTLPRSGAFLARRQILVVAHCAALVGRQRSVAVEVPEGEVAPPPAQEALTLMRALWNVALAFLNACVGVVRPHGKVRIVASDYWRNIAPVLLHLPEAEVVMYDRKEALNAGIKNIWRYRMKFMHAADFARRAQYQADALDALVKKWDEIQCEFSDDLVLKGISVEPLVGELLDELVRIAAPTQAQEIDRIYAMLKHLKPTAVLLRATVSQQWHFLLLALVAKELNIPSVELVHGMEYVGQGSLDKRHLAAYVGVYGAQAHRQLVAAGFPSERAPVIGSPRFDAYKRSAVARTDSSSVPVHIFCTAPDLFMGITFDTYDIEDYFKSVADAVRGLDVHVTIKLRPGPRREAFYRRTIAEAFKDIPHTVAQYERLQTLFAQADMAVSCQSTVTLEALQCGVPLTLYAATPVERMMLEHNFADMAQAGGVKLCLNAVALRAAVESLAGDPAARKTQAAAAKAYMAREFSFDGKAAERTAELIRSLATRGRVQ